MHRAASKDGRASLQRRSVRIDDLGADDIALAINVWLASQRSRPQECRLGGPRGVLATFRDAGIGLPDPDLRFIATREPPGGA